MIGVYAVSTDRVAAFRNSVLLVNGVNPGSSAALAGLMPGDVILMVNGIRVPTAGDFVAQFMLSGPIATVTYVSGFDGSLRVAAVLADPLGRIGAFIVPVPWR
jgi:S1-C subfamily serine protease